MIPTQKRWSKAIRMKFKYLILIFFIVSSLVSFSQNDKVTIHGFIYDLNNNKRLSAQINIFEEDSLKQILLSDTIEGYRFQISEQKKYKLLITKDYYASSVETIELSNNNNNEILKNIGLMHIEISIDYRIKNVYFDKNSSEIKPNDSLILNSMTELLIKHPNFRIEINGNCDNDEVINKKIKIDELRAKKVYDFLVMKGIDKSRLEYKGFKDLHPIASNKTDKEKAMNRRVEFVLDLINK